MNKIEEGMVNLKNKIKRPLIFSGGFSNLKELEKLKKYSYLSLSIASTLHYNNLTIDKIKNA